VLGFALACAAGPPAGERPDPAAGVEIVESSGVLRFYRRATAFYARMARRRFNTLATFQDTQLRGYFRDELSFTDYYAALANELAEHHFEKSRPLELEVQEWLVEGPGRARVKVRIEGANALPLRVRGVALEREDRWERIDGEWWVVAGKL
jgi:hypothetical protein